MVFDSRCIVKNHTLGEGGFGAVFAGFIREEVGGVTLIYRGVFNNWSLMCLCVSSIKRMPLDTLL